MAIKMKRLRNFTLNCVCDATVPSMSEQLMLNMLQLKMKSLIWAIMFTWLSPEDYTAYYTACSQTQKRDLFS